MNPRRHPIASSPASDLLRRVVAVRGPCGWHPSRRRPSCSPSAPFPETKCVAYLAVDALYRAGYSAGPSSTPRLEGKHVFLQARLSSDRTEVSLQGGLGNADIFAPRRLEATSSDSHRVPSCTPGASNAGPEDARRVKGRESRSSRSRTSDSGMTRACATSREPVVRPLVRPEVTFPSAVTINGMGLPGSDTPPAAW